MKQTAVTCRTVSNLRAAVLSLPLASLCFAAMVLAGCGGEQKAKSGAGHDHSNHAGSAAVSANAHIVPADGKLTIEAADDMRFTLREFVVRPGQQVELTLNHTGRMPLSAMGHNVVILKKYTNMNAFAQAAIRSARTDYIPPAMAEQVVAHTKMLGGGESDTITFTAPTEVGAYDFICSFPAHLTAGMRGKMIVRKD